MEITGTDPDRYLRSIDADDVRDTMIALDGIIRAALVGRSRDLWQGTFWGGTDQTIIGYGRILQPRPRGPEVAWFLIGLARQNRNYSLYVNATSDGRYLSHTYEKQLGNVKIGAANIGFTTLGNVNKAALRDMLETAHDLTPADSW